MKERQLRGSVPPGTCAPALRGEVWSPPTGPGPPRRCRRPSLPHRLHPRPSTHPLRRRRRRRLRAPLPDLRHRIRKELPILGHNNRVDRRPENFAAQCGELVLELDTDIEGGLTTKCYIDAVWSFVLDDLAYEFGRHWQEINLVREALRGRNSGDVGIDEDRVDAFLLQGLDGLRT